MEKSTCANVTVRFPCQGRKPDGSSALQEGVAAEARMSLSPVSRIISCNVECTHNTGGHGQRCMASHPGTEKLGKGVLCPFSFDYPYVLEYDRNWEPPEELKRPLEALKLLLP